MSSKTRSSRNFFDYQEATGFFSCPACGNRGWYLEQDRFYMPAMVLHGDGSCSEGELEYLADNPHETMRWTSIRCRPSDTATGPYVVPGIYKQCFEDRELHSASSVYLLGGEKIQDLSPGIYREAVNGEVYNSDAAAIRTWKGSEIKNKETLDLVRDQIRAFDEHYQNLQVRQAFNMNVSKNLAANVKNKKTKKILDSMASKNNASKERAVLVDRRVFVRVSGPGCTFCLNKGGRTHLE